LEENLKRCDTDTQETGYCMESYVFAFSEVQLAEDYGIKKY